MFSLNGAYRLSEQLKLSVGVDNLFDKPMPNTSTWRVTRRSAIPPMPSLSTSRALAVGEGGL
ncbi:TonB-dependent receptor [Halopseudomonas pachastrellae]|nr:TonB-dependent receptor [Halopseudomonas pachastrellae]